MSELSVALLRAVNNAAWEAERDGWASVREIRYAFDGTDEGRGVWSRNLWKLEAEGLLETKPIPAGRFLWGLTNSGLALLESLEGGA